MIKKIVFLVVMMLPMCVFAVNFVQTGIVKGKVENKITNLPIEKALVFISGEKFKTLTDANGEFIISNIPEGIYSIEIRSEGFKPEIIQNVHIEKNKTKEINISLNYFEIMGEKMVIKAPVTIINEPITSSFHFQSKEIKNQVGDYQDVVKTITTLPGVVADGDLNSAMYVRGGEAFENAFFIDRAYIYYPYHWGNMFSIVDPELVDSVNFYAGGFPAEYPYAYSSVIDINYEEGKTKKAAGEIVTSTHTASFKIGKLSEDERFSWIVSGRRTYIDWFMDALNYKNPGGKSDFVLVPYLGEVYTKVKYKLTNKDILFFSFLHAKDGAKMSGVPEESKEFTDTNEFHAYNTLNSYALDWKHIHTKDAISHITLTHQNEQVDVEEINNSNEKIFFILNPKNYNLRYDFSFCLNDKNMIKTGFIYENSKMDFSSKLKKESMYESNPGEKNNDLRNNAEDEYVSFDKYISDKTGGLYIQDEMKVTNKTKSNFGMRADSHNKMSSQKWTYSPRIGFSYEVVPKTIIKTAWGNYYNLSDVTLYSTLDTDKNKIKPEQSTHYIIGIEHDMGENVFLRTETYYKNLDNIAVYDTTQKIYTNQGDGFSYGLEFFLQKKKCDNQKYDGWITYSYAVTKRTAHDSIGWYYPQQDQTHTLNIIYNYKFTKKFSIGLKGNLHTGKPYTPVIGREEIQGKPGEYRALNGTINSKRFPLYHKLDVRLEWLVSEKKDSTTTMYLDLFNIYQHQNIYNYTWNKDFTKDRAIYDAPLLPIHFGVKTEF
ncbi:TonB-dependent receptor [Candidatus Poribacteria bacterium]|nr:TonB-dependent receptor [Candidatus Poribacteria bacterium]